MKTLPVLNPKVAAIDVGSEQLHLSIARDAPVVFETFTDDVYRLRAVRIIGAGSQVQKMQQALERMNIKFHDVISDPDGVSGLKVVRAILVRENRIRYGPRRSYRPNYFPPLTSKPAA